MNQATTKLLEYLQKNHPDLELPDPSWDGGIHRYGPKHCYWCVSEKVGEVYVACGGDWRDDSEWSWSSKRMTKKEKDLLEDMRGVRRAEQIKEWEATAKEVQTFWSTEEFQPYGEHEYINKKGLTKSSLYGARIKDGRIYVPLFDSNGVLWSYQWVAPDGTKGFCPASRTKGVFHTIGVLKGATTVYICEGFATGASVWECLGQTLPVVCAMGKANLMSVGEALREAYPKSDLIFCADHDEVGLKAARQAATQVGGKVAIPPTEGHDFNDMHQEQGREEVCGVLRGALQRELMALEPRGKAKQVSEEQMAMALIHHYGSTLCIQQGILWLYNGRYWEECDKDMEFFFKRQLGKLYGPNVTMRVLDGAFRHFQMKAPQAPRGVDLYMPNPFFANFTNGTLSVRQDPKTRKYVMDFREGHRPEDYLTCALDHEFSWEWSERNTELDAMLDRVFAGDPDKEEKIKALSQMYGACLIPAFPRLFFLHGKPGTGKSTAIHLAKLLVNQQNTCKVDPTQLHGFHLETMVNKLVNYVTDTKVGRPMCDEVLKRVVDRDMEYIQRKGKKNIYGYLPPIHIYGGNQIPNTLDTSGAHERRWTFIEFQHSQLGANQGRPDLNYWSFLYETSKRGFLNFALRGLKELCDQEGHFTMPASGRATMKEWELESDPVGLFISAIQEPNGYQFTDGNTQVIFDDAGKVVRQNFWEAYRQWHFEEYGMPPKCGRNSFYSDLRRRGFSEVMGDGGVRYFKTSHIVAVKNASF